MSEKEGAKPIRCSRFRCLLVVIAVLLVLVSAVILAAVFLSRTSPSTLTSPQPPTSTSAINQTRKVRNLKWLPWRRSLFSIVGRFRSKVYWPLIQFLKRIFAVSTKALTIVCWSTTRRLLWIPLYWSVFHRRSVDHFILYSILRSYRVQRRRILLSQIATLPKTSRACRWIANSWRFAAINSPKSSNLSKYRNIHVALGATTQNRLLGLCKPSTNSLVFPILRRMTRLQRMPLVDLNRVHRSMLVLAWIDGLRRSTISSAPPLVSPHRWLRTVKENRSSTSNRLFSFGMY